MKLALFLQCAVALATARKVICTQTPDEIDFPNGVQRVALRTFSLDEPYLHDGLHSRWYDYGGDAVIKTDSYVRLTHDRPSQVGFVSSRLPLTATSFEVTVDFKISGKGNLYGDGMAIWITKERAQMGPVFGGPDMFDGLGLFIDTYKNNRPGITFPYMMAMHGDGKTHYNKDDDGKHNELAGCSVRGIHNGQNPSKVRITYIKDQLLKVELDFKDPGKWTTCFKVESPPVLPTSAYLSISAETGELSENHDIISVEVNNLFVLGDGAKGRPVGGKSNSKYHQTNSSKRSSSWFGFIVKLLSIGGGIYAVYKLYVALVSSKQAKKSDLMF
ncbi:concanavalin A-like lectin/glucanase domain-containing protein [Lipomyces oligophaga]|uniref:concanavalin A-like lectin/glucanase domain-containing protein n=1 Tax=Lipomyces oligophaga TaxID=45792 RepID=UPI0034CF8EB5